MGFMGHITQPNHWRKL